MDGSTHSLKYESFTLYLCPSFFLMRNFGSLSPVLASHCSTSVTISPTSTTTTLFLSFTCLIISTLRRLEASEGCAGDPWPESPIS